jgi:hypothetical protein
MKQIPDNILKKIKEIDQNVKDDLLQKGIVVPIKFNDGSIKVGDYFIKKSKTGFYSVMNIKGHELATKINLPQTAAIIANKLALGKFLDDRILKNDTEYGYALFDEESHSKLAQSLYKKKESNTADVMLLKSSTAKRKKERIKKDIDLSFEKLLRFR